MLKKSEQELSLYDFEQDAAMQSIFLFDSRSQDNAVCGDAISFRMKFHTAICKHDQFDNILLTDGISSICFFRVSRITKFNNGSIATYKIVCDEITPKAVSREYLISAYQKKC